MAPLDDKVDQGAWQRLLARWGLLTAITVAGLVVTFFTAFGLAFSEPGIGSDHDELLMAASVPVLYRTAMVFDALGWLAMGGLVLIAGLALRRDATIQGPVGAVLGVTAIAGIVGAFLRLTVVGYLGRQLAAGVTDEAGLISLYRTVDLIIGAHFGAGQLTVGLGFLVVGSAALAAAWVPRSIAWLLLLPGITSLVLLAAEVAFDVFLFPVLLLHVLLLAIVGLAMAGAWWRAPLARPGAAEIQTAGA
ncbi:MAG TPA: hypothetical protein VGQ02_04095 [Candidatus Limnocylindrales bacterium]|jgi:hypothetical protein|nr:hypothetical protein [Candidatus Limnocylindrales bacterium]